jgi:broad specificity phosphatase PhoE
MKNGDQDKTGSYLRPEGRVRARALVDAIGEMDVTAIYSPDIGRNLETVQPLADLLGLKVNIISGSRLANTPKLANEFVEEVLSKHAGGVVVWVGNASAPVGPLGGNLQRIYQRLGGTGEPPVKYGDLFIIVVPDMGPVKITKSRFGE